MIGLIEGDEGVVRAIRMLSDTEEGGELLTGRVMKVL